jgi:hypothetical protein
MMEAYMIEALKERGYNFVSYEQAVQQGIELEEVEGLIPLYEKNAPVLAKAFDGDYAISFVTYNGFRNLIKMRYGIPLDSYRLEPNGIFDLNISNEIIEEITKFLSINWTVERKGERVSFYVKGK